ncbi:tcea1 [Symbiodinium pilosum]|uniref:Tcea1 protein n=1 Tax=Symbiodinium pilosum TaxID=2952 RepID=A0A812WIV2_SYMPI|nr:tcea1 [Symbiodinium pilosum]
MSRMPSRSRRPHCHRRSSKGSALLPGWQTNWMRPRCPACREPRAKQKRRKCEVFIKRPLSLLSLPPPWRLRELCEERTVSWGSTRRLRSVALLLVYVSRSTRVCRGVFVAQGLPLLGELLSDAVQVLEAGPISEHQEAGMRISACLRCLTALAVGRATMWEHRQILGKAFDRLHRWCSQEKSALAAELRAPTQALTRRWRQQPKPAVQDTPANKALRVKVLELIKQGLEATPASSQATVASEIEAALYTLYAGATSDYRSHARMLRHNMMQPENEALRRRILTGELGAQDLVQMDSRSLAPETLQEKRRAEELAALKSVVIAEGPLKTTVSVPQAFDWRDETYNPSVPKDDEGPREQVTVAENSAEFMEQPTPLRTISTSSAGAGAPSTPEAMATPAPDDDDEQNQDLIRHFSQRVH